MIRLLRVVIGAFCLLAVLTGAVVYGTRESNAPACITLLQGNNRLLYDAFRGLITKETRYPLGTRYLFSDLNYMLMAYRDPENPDLARLVLEPNEGGEAILLESMADEPANYWSPRRALWIPDPQRLVYLWMDADGRKLLTVFDWQSQRKQTADLTSLGSARTDLSLVEYSADGAYLTLAETGTIAQARYFLLSIEDMRAVSLGSETESFITVAWSPEGHRLAGVTETSTGSGTLNSVRTLVLMSPESPEDAIRIPLATNLLQTLAWSPDGQRLTVARQVLNREAGLLVYRWHFDIYEGDGTPLQQDVIGIPIRTETRSTPAGLTLVPANFVAGLWSLDGRSWIYLEQDAGESGNTNADPVLNTLVSLDVITGERTVIESGLAADFYTRMFFSAPQSNTLFFNRQALIPDNKRLLLPLWRNNRYTLDYLDLEDNRRYTLVEGARELLDERFLMVYWLYVPHMENLVVLYRDDQDMLHVRVFRTQDGTVIADIGGIRQLSALQWMADSLGYIASRDGTYNLEMVDVETANHERLMSGLRFDAGWRGVVAPNRQRVAFLVNRDNTYNPSSAGTLYISKPLDDPPLQIDENVVLYPRWSDDGTLLAYFYGAGNQRIGLRVVTSEGTPVSQSSELGGTTSQWGIERWGGCASMVAG